MQPAGTIWRKDAPRAQAYFAAALLVVVAVAVGSVLRRLPHANLSLLFLLAVLIVAAVWGLWPSIFATVLSFLAINYFFTVPLYTFSVQEEGDLASMVFFLAMAALTANLAARMRNEMAESRSALQRVSTLLEFSGKMSSALDVESALQALTGTIARTLNREVAVWLPADNGQLRLAAVSDDARSQLDTSGLNEVLQASAEDIPLRDDVTFLSLDLTDSRSGIVCLGGGILGPEERKFADGLCEQSALAVERILLVENLKTAQLAAQTEQLRAALLSSVSHDLRTPLASIIGSVSSVLEYRDILKKEDQHDLLQTVLDESQRLNRYIQNLLDMTRFGQQQIELKREWADLNDLVSAACERFGRTLRQFDVDVEISSEVALICVHGALIEQALVNIVDNALDFSEPGGAIKIRAFLEEDATIIDVIDEGPGIPEAEREKVFEMFYMAQQPDDRRHGVGLGLAICRSIIEAHGGTIDALSGPNRRGTCVRIRLPVAENPIGENDA
jgi:two-component system sensor histidine kinase KdpD